MPHLPEGATYTHACMSMFRVRACVCVCVCVCLCMCDVPVQGSIRASWEPDGMMLPYSSASLWVEPMCLSLGGNALITQLGQGE